MFAVPSDPPSTPDSRRGSHGQEPSTTPAAPPPTGYTAQSFTPAGAPPPSSIFGDSYGNTFNAKTFNATGTSAFSNPRPSVPSFNPQPAATSYSRPQSGAFAVPSSPPQNFVDQDSADGYEEEGDGYGGSMFGHDFQPTRHATFPSANPLPSKHTMPTAQPYPDYDSPRSLKRSRYGQVMGNAFRSSKVARLNNRQPVASSTARTFAKPGPASLEEPDDLILKSEQSLAALDASAKAGSPEDLDVLTEKTTQELSDLWKKHVSTRSLSGGIGPKNQKSNLDKSNYLASLLLRLHHPYLSQHKSKPDTTAFGRSSRFMQLVRQREALITVPRSLLDWLNTYHNPFPEDLPEVLANQPSPVAHEKFWDMVYATTLRGDLATAISLLESANFTQADTAMDDGYDRPGYLGEQAEAAAYVVSRCVDLLRSCPAYAEDDWDVKNADWAIFRNRVRREHQDLEAFAESESKDRDTSMDGGNVFQSSAMAPGRSGLSFSKASRRAESKVPWTVYQNLKILYGQLQGVKDEIAVCTQDWLETAICMTVWWDGEDDDSTNMAASRQSLRQSQMIRPVDVSPTSAYRRQLLYAFATVTDEPEETVFAVNTLDPIQVGLACICEEDVEGLLGILRGWSLPIASAVVEIANAGGWLPRSQPRSQTLLDGFDQDDLMVLSHGQDEQQDSFQRDDVLTTYADYLAREDCFTSSDKKTSKEGWNLACRVLSRLDNLDNAQRRIGELLANLPLESAQRVDKVLAVCIDIGLTDQVRAIAERYADALAETSQSYGGALIYYARAHSQQKLKATIDLLISMCLIQSSAFPPRSSLDTQLGEILNDQRTAITRLAKIDQEAAQLVATYLSGYATLRKFYALRDEGSESTAEDAPKSGLRPLARKHEAAKSLLALIESAADSIRGGLHDSEVETVVQVDTLMALLCETLPLMNQRKPILDNQQLLMLLRAVEDLEAVTPLVYDQTESLFKSAIANFSESPVHLVASQDLAKSVSGALMNKSTHSLAGSGYGMVNSNGSLATTNGDGGDKVEANRGWDWRAGAVYAMGKNVTGEQVLRVLRAQVAKEIAKAWMHV